MLIFHLFFTLLPGVLALATGHVSRRGGNESVSANCEQTCTELSLEFGDRLHYPDDDQFAIWDQKQQRVRYACRVEPTSSSEVSKIMQVLVKNWCRFAVKCGGHSRFPDDSNSVGGVTVDLHRLNTVELAADHATARVGGGATSHQVFEALNPMSLSSIGGRVGTVGLGGFTLGGGTSVVSAEYGWALDNVFEYEVVLPNATIATVAEDQNPDLYFALRGGGNNFGIVTSLTVRVFSQGSVFTGIRTYGDNVTHRFLEEADKVFTIEDHDTSVGFEYTYSYVPAQDRYRISSTQRYSQPILNPPVFNDINQIPFESSFSIIDTLANGTMTNGPLGVTRNVFATITHFPSLELSKRVIQIYQEEVQLVKNVTGITPSWITYSIPAGAIRAMKQRGGNALGIDVEGHLLINLLATGWTNPEDDERVYSFADNFIRRFKEAAVALDAYHPYIYINYANRGQDVFSGYGERNKQRLIAIQKAIDPLGVFTSRGLWRGFFKLL